MKILLQIWIFSIFIFSNGYQSLVTSFMLNPLQIPLLKTVNEVFESDLNIHDFWAVDQLYDNNSKYQKAKQDGRVRVYDVPYYTEKWPEYLIENHVVYYFPCKTMKMTIENEVEGAEWRGLYQISESIYSFPEDLLIRPLHPYIIKFQEIMDQTLEAGLHQAWEKTYFKLFRDFHFISREKKPERDLLDFNLIAPFFLILAVGSIAALLTLFFEIFYHDFISELTKDYFREKFNEYLRREIKIN